MESSYQAIVCHLATRPHPNADKVKLGRANGYQVVVGLDTPDGALGVFFGCDGQLSERMCMENKLYRKHPVTEEPMGGYFEKNRRVRPRRFRGEISDGFWIPLSKLGWTGADLTTLKAGDQFCELNGHEICCKYVPPATRRAMQGQPKTSKRLVIPMFKEHYDTKQLRHNLRSIPQNSVVYLTEKLHGTSGRTGTVLVEEPLTGLKKLVNKLYPVFKPKKVWKKVTGSRRVTFDPDQTKDKGYYAGTKFRFLAAELFKPRKGETFYYEIVGFDENGRAIMSPHGIEDKKLKKQFGDSMVYSYGCERDRAPSYAVYVYRITQTNESGDAVDLSWPQVVSRCRDLGLNVVPEFDRFLYVGEEDLLERVKSLADGVSSVDDRHIREGVCVRVEHEDMFDVMKYKGYHFCELEDIRKNDDEYVDLEDIS